MSETIADSARRYLHDRHDLAGELFEAAQLLSVIADTLPKDSPLLKLAIQRIESTNNLIERVRQGDLKNRP